MSRRSKILTTGCLLPIVLILLCGGVFYLMPERMMGLLGGLLPNQTDETLEVLAENQEEPAVDWDVLEPAEQTESIEPAENGEADGAVEEPATAPIVEPDVIEVRFQGRTADVDPAALGINRIAELTNDAGQPSIVLEYGEVALNEMLLPQMAAEIPAEFADQVNLNEIDLAPGAININGEVDTGFIGFQPLSMTVVAGEDGKSLEILGVSVGGFSIDSVGAGPLEDAFAQAEQEINRVLNDVVVVAADGSELPLNTIFLGDDVMQVVFEK